MIHFYVAIQSAPSGLGGMAIRTATEAFCKPPWVMGPSHPATHAFLMWEHPDGVVYRLDGKPPRSELSMYPVGWTFEYPTAVWRLQNADEALTAEHRRAMLSRAVALVGIDYSFLEAIVQSMPLPPGFKTMDPLKNCALCTRVVLEAMEAGSDRVKAAVKAMPDLFPEHLGRILQTAVDKQEAWIQRVV